MTLSSDNLNIGFLASHGGSNLQALLDAISTGALPVRASVVISNNSGSMALERARAAGVPALHLSGQMYTDPDALDQAILHTLRASGVNLVVLAGYMKKLGPRVLEAYRGRVLNIHPALLPKHGGQGMYGIHVHEAVLAAGDEESGVSVHLVDAEYDRGPVIAQVSVPVQAGDTPQTLQQRVLAEEHRLYPETLRRIAAGEIDLDQL